MAFYVTLETVRKRDRYRTRLSQRGKAPGFWTYFLDFAPRYTRRESCYLLIFPHFQGPEREGHRFVPVKPKAELVRTCR